MRASAECDRFGFVIFFGASFDIKMCQFALLMLELEFVIAVWGSEFLLRMLTVITKGSQLKGPSVTFQDRMGFKRGMLF